MARHSPDLSFSKDTGRGKGRGKIKDRDRGIWMAIGMGKSGV